MTSKEMHVLNTATKAIEALVCFAKSSQKFLTSKNFTVIQSEIDQIDPSYSEILIKIFDRVRERAIGERN